MNHPVAIGTEYDALHNLRSDTLQAPLTHTSPVGILGGWLLVMEVKYYCVLVVVLDSTMLALVAKKPNKHLLPLKYAFVLIFVKTGLAPVVVLVTSVSPVKRFYWLDCVTGIASSFLNLSAILFHRDSSTDRTGGFYPLNEGSIPSPDTF